MISNFFFESPTRLALALIAVVVLSSSPKAVASPLITVGADPSCDTANLQQALSDVSSGGVVLIANNQSYDGLALEISQKSVTVIGGLPSCSSIDPTGRTVLGNNNSRAINIGFGSSSFEVKLVNLEITGVNSTSDGAGIRIGNRTHLKLENVLIHGNTTTGRGGAIFMNGQVGQRLSVDLPGTEFSNNQARLGGAIYCDESSGAIRGGLIDLNTVLISNNHATEDGGGIYLEDCNLNMRAGAREDGQVVAGIHANRADRHGGGIDVRGSAKVVLEPAELIDNQPLIDSNIAASWGGGLFCSERAGNRPQVTMIAGLISANQATAAGGMNLNGCDVDVFASGPDQGIQNNLARILPDQSGNASGGGIRVTGGTVLNIDGGNRAFSPAKQAVYLAGNRAEGGNAGAMNIFDSQVTLTDVRIEGNSARFQPTLTVTRSELTIQHSDDGDCPVAGGPDGCSQIIGNFRHQATVGGNIGIAMLISNDANVTVDRTVIRGNHAVTSGAIFAVQNNSAEPAPAFDVTSSLIVDNETQHLLSNTGNGKVRIAWSTLADNVAVGNNPGLFSMSGSGADTPTLDLISSIIWEPEGNFSDMFLFQGTALLQLAHCLVTHDPQAVEAEADTSFRVIGDNPRFGAPQRGDWTVSQKSPAFQCDITFYNGEADLLGAQRGILTTLPGPNPVIFAAGAYSVRSADILFTDRFAMQNPENPGHALFNLIPAPAFSD